MKIIELRAENVKRLKAVHIRPASDVVVIGGENEQGKTSIFDFIRMAIGGAKATPDVPIRRGANDAGGTLDMGELVVDLHIDASGRKVIVRNADGTKQAKPQDILDKLYSKVAFDPLAFSLKKPAEQQKILKDLVGLDFAKLDAERARAYEKRTEVGRVRADAEARITTCPLDCLKAPDNEVSISALVGEKDAADTHNQLVQTTVGSLTRADAEISRLEAVLAQAQKDKLAWLGRLASMGPKVETVSIVGKIRDAESVNVAVRAKKSRAEAVAKFKEQDALYERLTQDVTGIDNEKTLAMKNAKWPIPGLGFSADGITFDGLPFEQSSKAQRMKVSLAIGAALNPTLQVILLEDASLLDKASMAVVYEVAKERDMQIWVERVGDGDPGAIIIEDGMVAENSDA